MTSSPQNTPSAPSAPSLLVTGASGFIGSFIVEEALARGFEVWAAVRATTSRRYLTDARLHFIELDLGNEERLRRQLADHVAQHGPWHHVVHAAGATKCRRPEDFALVNTEGTERLARLLLATRALRHRLLFISSLSICGPLHEDTYAPLTAADVPQPNTAYGHSKWAAECLLGEIPGLDYVVLRPTGVYGPRERDYFMMAKSIAGHVDFAVGYRRQVITFVYVRDVATAVFQALERGRRGRAYFLTDGGEYASRTFSDLLQQALGVRRVVHFTAPLWLLRLICGAGSLWGRLTGRAVTLNTDKYHIMKQRNWRCDITPACNDFGYAPRYPLERGVTEAVAWYQQHQWL